MVEPAEDDLHRVVPRLLPVPEVAYSLAVSVSTVRRLIRSGDLRAVRVGAQVRVSPSELAAYTGRDQAACSGGGNAA
jgi:excisionase family DNA binding protein